MRSRRHCAVLDSRALVWAGPAMGEARKASLCLPDIPKSRAQFPRRSAISRDPTA
jgi:hypothetical protein